jgi:hypothetical protein
MKRIVWSLFFFVAAVLIILRALAVAQDATPITQPLHAYYTYGQLKGVTTQEALRGAAAATTIPMWSYTVTANRDGSTRAGVMVGRSPFFHGARTTAIPAFIVPVKVHMPDGGVFDPGASDSKCLGSKVPTTVFQNSPLFQATDFFMNGTDIGTAQYIDAFQRANFFAANASATGNRYHTMLSTMTLSEQTFTVPSGQGETFSVGGCEHLGVMDISTFDAFVQGTIVPFVAAHGGGPTSLPIILLYNVVMANPFVPGTTHNCCILGYHSVFSTPAVQTYSVADFDSVGVFMNVSDVAAPSHEIGEWMDDPLGNNIVPSWGNIGQVSGCQFPPNLEVGDPLSGTLFPSVTQNSFTYHMQELAFFSWFIGSPSVGVGGDFSNNGTFKGDAVLCPPGGTN